MPKKGERLRRHLLQGSEDLKKVKKKINKARSVEAEEKEELLAKVDKLEELVGKSVDKLKKLEKAYSEEIERYLDLEERTTIFDACKRVRDPCETMGWVDGVPIFNR